MFWLSHSFLKIELQFYDVANLKILKIFLKFLSIIETILRFF